MNVRLGTLRVWGSVDQPGRSTPEHDPPDPAGRISCVGAPDHGNAEVDNGQNHAANRLLRKRAVIGRAAFDQQICPGRRLAQFSELWPESTVVDGEMKPSRGLPLDKRKVTNCIVTRAKMILADINTELNELAWHAAWAFVSIGDDLHSLRLPQRSTRDSSNLGTKVSTSDFAWL
jgi:hypothetical protein